MDYNFVETKTQFGIEWYDDKGELIGTDWYDTEEERNEAVDHWYAEQDEFNPEQ
jgi:hypothetical protein